MHFAKIEQWIRTFSHLSSGLKQLVVQYWTQPVRLLFGFVIQLDFLQTKGYKKIITKNLI